MGALNVTPRFVLMVEKESFDPEAAIALVGLQMLDEG